MWSKICGLGQHQNPIKKTTIGPKLGIISPVLVQFFVFFYGSVDGYGSPIEKYPDGGSGSSTADTR